MKRVYYKAFGYPVIPVIYILMAGTMALGLLFYKPATSLFGLLIVLIGVPIYYIAMRSKKVAEFIFSSGITPDRYRDDFWLHLFIKKKVEKHKVVISM